MSVLALELLAAIEATQLFLFILILSRQSIPELAVIYFLSYQLAMIVRGLLWAFYGSLGAKPKAELAWAWLESIVRHRLLFAVQFILIIVIILLAYPIVSGIIFFGSSVPSRAETLSIIRVTLLFISLSGFVLLIGSQAGLLTSENASRTARFRQLAFYIGNLIPIGILLAVLFSSFNTEPSPSAGALGLGALSLSASPLIFVLLTAFFIVSVLLPYLVGQRRAALWSAELQERELKLLTAAAKVLREPADIELQLPRLRELIEESMSHRRALMASDMGAALGIQLDKILAKDAEKKSTPSSDVNQESGSLTETGNNSDLEDSLSQDPRFRGIDVVQLASSTGGKAFPIARAADPRFIYLDSLGSFEEKLRLTMADLGNQATAEDRIARATLWASSIEDDRRDLAAAPLGSPAKGGSGSLVVTTIVTSILSALFTGLGSWLWTHAARTLPR
jgi:hypothetical protein